MNSVNNLYKRCYEEPEFDPIHPDVIFGKNVKVRYFVVIENDCKIGDDSFIGNFVMIRSGCKFGKKCVIGHSVVFESNGIFGNHVTINSNSHMTQGIIVEDDVFFGPGVVTMNTRHISYGRKNVPKTYTPPIIKRASRIGAGSLILPGVTVGENALVAAGSVVTKDVQDRTIVMGIPAKIIGEVPENEIL